MTVGKKIIRVDALDKALGRAKFTEDLIPKGALYAKVLHSTIANGLVKSIDTAEAEKLRGVEKVVTCFDVPDIQFATAGHPWTLEEERRDVADRKLLNKRVRHYGDCIAAVVAKDELTAEKAVGLIKVEYEEYPAIVDAEKATEEGAPQIHEESSSNVLKKTVYSEGDWDRETSRSDTVSFQGTYTTVPVQHCHIENGVSFAYMEGERIVVVTSTQIPHIIRRVVAQSMGIPIGRVRIIKPYIGGGFGNKQDALYEPLNAFLTTQVEGRCVVLNMTREETFHSSRTRHGIRFQLKTWVDSNGLITARESRALSNQGGYASHGHTIVSNATSAYRNLYHQNALRQESVTVYTNLASGGAMRGYGIPQINFAMESHMDDLAKLIGMDPIEFRRKNMMTLGDLDKPTGIKCHSNGLNECLDAGARYSDWHRKRELYKNQSGNIRRGIGMAIFSYKSGAYPSAMEIASARVLLVQDGSVMVEMGATEIGQGADTIFVQMASEVLSIPPEKVHIVTMQDTDRAPFDTGAYASRQTYVSGAALKKTCLVMRGKLLKYAAGMLDCEESGLDIADGVITDKDGRERVSLKELATHAFYNRADAHHITAEESYLCKNNTYALGCCFAEIEVDLKMGRIKIEDIINVHDSGKIINPALAASQIHGGMAMGIGYALYEQMLYNDKGRLLNGNLLDYKIPTAMDVPELNAAFVETEDPTGPFGNKSLGEPPTIPVAAAIRNALLNATGVAVNQLPLNPPRLIEEFKSAGLIEGGEKIA
jgi:xanthine dehydrogenase molybdenum-binding subunit